MSWFVLCLVAACGCSKAGSPTPAAPTRATNPSSADPAPAAAPTPATAVASAASPAPPARSAVAAPVGPCLANEVTMNFGGRDGEFTGMSHDGAILILKNTGKRDCTVPKRPFLTFTDAAGKAVALTVNVPPGMHPGPVLAPVMLKPGASASGKMRWVMGEVYDPSVCVKPAHASLDVQGGTVTKDFDATVCGPARAVPHYEQEWLQPGTTGDSPSAAQ